MKRSKSKDVEEDVIYVDEDGNPIEVSDDDEYEYIEEEVAKGPGKLALSLNKKFHFIDRGGSLGGEFVAGLTMGFIAICIVFLNMQVIGNMLTADVTLVNQPQTVANIEAAETYFQLYAGSIIVSILGTIAIGVAANLPLVQIASMGLSGALLCLLETGSGLTYENLLFVNLIAGILYAVIVFVPVLRNFIAEAVPASIRKALPAATGLIFAYLAIRLSGFVTADTVSLGGGSPLATLTGHDVTTSCMAFAALVGAIVAIVLYIVLKMVKKGRPVLFSLFGGTIVYVLITIAQAGIDYSNSGSFISLGRVYIIAGSQSSAVTPFADSYLTYALGTIEDIFGNLGNVIAAGADFSAYSGNAIALIVSGVLCYLFGALFEADGTIVPVAAEIGVEGEELQKSDAAAKQVNAVTAVVAPFLGAGGVTLSKASVAGAQDRAKSGLASIFACLILLISLFVMVFPALFATSTYPVNSMADWNYFAYGNGGVVYVLRAVAFGVADIVMACVGIFMAVSLKDLKGARELVPGIVMAVVSVISLNIVAGVACGLLLYLIMAIPARSKDPKAITVPMIVLEVLLVVATVLL